MPNPQRLQLQLLALWAAATAIACTGLGNLPLRDWDEGIVARVAYELSLRPWPHLLLPTLWGEAYLNKPPGLHWLMAAGFGLWRSFTGASPLALPPEWLVRLVPAMLSTGLVPMLGLIQARLRPRDPDSALATAAIALTLLPLARHGRLAMLDGTMLTALSVLWWSLLSAAPSAGAIQTGRQLGWGVLAGLATSQLLLLKAPAAAPLLLGSLLLRRCDHPWNRRGWILLLGGIGIGLLPGISWHLLHAGVRGSDAWEMWLGQGLARVGSSLEGHGGGPITPLVEMLEGGGPWLLLWPLGIGLAWQQRRQPAGRWALGITALCSGLVLPLQTQLPWYSLLLWPGFALVCGPVLAALVQPASPRLWRQLPWLWRAMGLGLTGVILVAACSGGLNRWPWIPIAIPLAVGLGLGGQLLLGQEPMQRRWGAIGLVSAQALSLLLLMASPLWLWELNESWSAPAAAQLLNRQPSLGSVAISPSERPSLNWYARQRIRRPSRRRSQQAAAASSHWLAENPPQPERLRCSVLGSAGEVNLYRCEPRTHQPA